MSGRCKNPIDSDLGIRQGGSMEIYFQRVHYKAERTPLSSPYIPATEATYLIGVGDRVFRVGWRYAEIGHREKSRIEWWFEYADFDEIFQFWRHLDVCEHKVVMAELLSRQEQIAAIVRSATVAMSALFPPSEVTIPIIHREEEDAIDWELESDTTDGSQETKEEDEASYRSSLHCKQ